MPLNQDQPKHHFSLTDGKGDYPISPPIPPHVPTSPAASSPETYQWIIYDEVKLKIDVLLHKIKGYEGRLLDIIGARLIDQLKIAFLQKNSAHTLDDISSFDLEGKLEGIDGNEFKKFVKNSEDSNVLDYETLLNCLINSKLPKSFAEDAKVREGSSKVCSRFRRQQIFG